MGRGGLRGGGYLGSLCRLLSGSPFSYLCFSFSLSLSSVCLHQALESLNKKDMTEIKSYGRPPALVEKVMEAVMILRGGEPTWAEAKRQLGEKDIGKPCLLGS